MIFPRIKDLRIDKDMNQEQMAEIVHVSQNTYSRYENGTISVPIEVLIELARFHNTSIDYLVNLTDIK